MHIQTSYTFQGFSSTGHTIDDRMWGGMMLHQTETLGSTGTFDLVSHDLNLSNFRWTSGTMTEEFWELANPNEWLPDIRGNSGIDRNEGAVTFSQFMAWSVDNGHPVSLIIPTQNLLIGENVPGDKNRALNSEALGHLETFLRQILDPTDMTFPKADVDALEIGNEYFSWMSSSEYGVVTNEFLSIVREIKADLIKNGTVSADHEFPQILVQAGNEFASDSKPGGAFHGMNFTDRIDATNDAVLSEIDAINHNEIDGIINHYFYNWNHIKQGEYDPTFGNDALEFRFFEEDYDIWRSALGNADLEYHITAWNVAGWADEHFGLKGASVLLEQFEAMIEHGVDASQLWGIQHATQFFTNDLTGQDGQTDLTFLGHAYNLMADNLQGATLLESNVTGENIEINAYHNGNKIIFFISSRSDATIDLDLNLENIVPDYTSVSGVQLGVLAGSANGAHFSPGNGLVYVEDYYNEHDALPELSDLDLQNINTSNISLTFNPFEVAMIEFEITDEAMATLIFSDIVPDTIVEGTQTSEQITGSNQQDSLLGAGGDDIIFSQHADDIIFAGNGHDWVSGGTGNDSISGGAGNDAIAADMGNDLIFAGIGADTVSGFSGNDIIYGGEGDDFLGGGSGDDLIYGGDGYDVIGAGQGNDAIYAGHGNNIASGGAGADTVLADAGDDTLAGSYGNDLIKSGNGNDSLGGGQGNDTLYGEWGSDTIGGGNNDDQIFGGYGDDFLAGGQQNDSIYGGEGNDSINGGNGSDILRGGNGTDVFIFNSQDKNEFDIITDFNIEEDIIRLKNIPNGFADLDIQTETIDGENRTIISYQDYEIHLRNIDTHEITEELFVFI